MTFNQVVGGSNPPCLIQIPMLHFEEQGFLFYSVYVFADMAELADALDLGSSGRPCRFKSCYPHNKKRRFMSFHEAPFSL